MGGVGWGGKRDEKASLKIEGPKVLAAKRVFFGKYKGELAEMLLD